MAAGVLPNRDAWRGEFTSSTRSVNANGLAGACAGDWENGGGVNLGEQGRRQPIQDVHENGSEGRWRQVPRAQFPSLILPAIPVTIPPAP